MNLNNSEFKTICPGENNMSWLEKFSIYDNSIGCHESPERAEIRDSTVTTNDSFMRFENDMSRSIKFFDYCNSVIAAIKQLKELKFVILQ